MDLNTKTGTCGTIYSMNFINKNIKDFYMRGLYE
jgi:hypothetical protein